MPTINEHFLKLKAGYLFPEIARRVNAYAGENPDAKIIRLGIGDVTEPLPDAVVQAMHKALDEQTQRGTFKGYGPDQGYPFLREAICNNDFKGLGIAPDEIFVSDGSKCDCGNILDIFGPGNKIAVTDPVYPVYVDTNVMAGHTSKPDALGEYGGLTYLRCTPENEFTPTIPEDKLDLIYLCYPNNPTGAVASKSYLKQWVDYAKAHDAVIFYDAAYFAFIQDPELPRSIYEIDGARDCAIEFRSFSKTAGFTGVRAGFTVVPKSLKGKTSTGEPVDLHRLWHRRQSTKFNGISYIVQRGCEACYSAEGDQQIASLIDHYMTNAAMIRKAMQSYGFTVFGGEHAPYVWVKCPDGVDSWTMFDRLLRQAQVVTTPGAGFGRSGEGFFRVSAFNSRQNVEEAITRLARLG